MSVEEASYEQTLMINEKRYLDLIESTQQHSKMLSEEALELKAKLADQMALILKLKEKNTDWEAMYKKVQEDLECLQAQNEAFQKTALTHERKNKDLNAELSDKTKENADLRDHIASLEKKFGTEKDHLINAGKKNELLLQQLYEVQEAMECYYFECRSKDEQLSQKEERLGWLRQQLKRAKVIIEGQRRLANQFTVNNSRLAVSLNIIQAKDRCQPKSTKSNTN
jgi:chromosome segregation ATPase